MESINTLTSRLNSINMTWLESPQIITILMICLIIYASFFINPKKPDLLKLNLLLLHPVVKVIALAFIMFVSTKNIQLGIMLSIIYVLLIVSEHESEQFDTVKDKHNHRRTADDQAYGKLPAKCICKCDSDVKSCKCDCKNSLTVNDYTDYINDRYRITNYITHGKGRSPFYSKDTPMGIPLALDYIAQTTNDGDFEGYLM